MLQAYKCSDAASTECCRVLQDIVSFAVTSPLTVARWYFKHPVHHFNCQTLLSPEQPTSASRHTASAYVQVNMLRKLLLKLRCEGHASVQTTPASAAAHAAVGRQWVGSTATAEDIYEVQLEILQSQRRSVK